MAKKYSKAPLKIAAIYASIGCLWILFSDRALLLFTGNSEIISEISIAKGWVFIILTAVLLYGFIQRLIVEVEVSEGKLKVNEEKFSKAFNYSSALMTISAIDNGLYIEVNEKFCHVSGFSRQEAIGKSSVELGWITAADREKLISALHRDGRVSDLELDLKAKDGSNVCCLYSAEIITIEDGQYLLSIALDITERKKNLEALDYVNECFTQALNGPEYVLYRLNVKNGCYDYLSPAFEKITGYPVDEFKKNGLDKVEELFHPDDRCRIFDSLGDLLRGRSGNTVNLDLEYRLKKADGGYCWLHDSTTVCFNDSNELEYFFGSAHDVTKRMETEKALKNSEERFRKIIEQSPISMAVVSMDGTIEYINNCAVDTFGYLPEDIPHMNEWWLKAYPETAYREQVIAQWMGLVEKAIAENRYIERSEYKVTCKNGTLKTMLIFGVMISDKVFVMFEDITKRKQAEDEINRLNTDLERMVAERTAELQRSNRDLASFCYAVSHELRAPVARLKGLSQALQEDLTENPDDVEYCARRIEVASCELQRVINSVLQLSRLSQSSFVPQPLDLSAIVREIATTLASEVPDRSVELVVAEDMTVSGDAALVRLCLENLLGNAFKYTSLQAFARIEFGRDAASGAFFVKDNGIGFDIAHADNLFEPFFRLHPDDEFAGSGIGLATVQRVIERHGGRIWAESSPGVGSAFYFTFTAASGGRNAP